MPSYKNGDVHIRYEEIGRGFPLLVTPGGGLNSRVDNWPTAVFNAMDVFPDPAGPVPTIIGLGDLRASTYLH